VRAKKKIIIPIVVLVILSIFIFFKMKKPPTSAMALPNIKVAKGDISVKVSALGKVESSKTQEVYPKVQGTVKYIAEEGQLVKKGDIVLELDNDDLISEFNIAESKLSQEEKQLEKLQKGVRSEELEKSRIRLQEAESLYDVALDDYTKNKGLYEAGAISQKEFQDFKNELDIKQNQLDIAKLDYEILANPDSDEIDIKQTVVDEARDELIKIKDKLKKTIVYAQMDGMVLKSDAEAGKVVSPGDIALIIADPSDLEIKIGVNEYDIGMLKVGQKCTITGDGFGDMTYHGEITKIAPMATIVETSRGKETSIKAILNILDADENIRPGFSANVEIVVEDRKNVLLLPLECVVDGPEGKKVAVIKDGEPVEKDVKTGIENELYVEILEGVNEGDEVLANPQNNG